MSPRRRPRSHLADAGVLFGGIVLGGAIAFGAGVVRAGSDEPAIAYVPDARIVVVEPVDLETGAATPSQAVEAFLAAEVDGRSDDSLELLSATDRLRFATASVWNRGRLGLIGAVVDYTAPVIVSNDGAEATAETELTLRPSLDATNGLTAPRANATLRLVEDDGWRVDLDGSEIAPLFVAEIDAGDVAITDAAAAWLTGDGACDPAAAAAPDAIFRGGRTSLVDELCSLDLVPPLGAPEPLAAHDAVELAATFGSDVRDWAEVVPVGAPFDVRLVLAPVGARWVVIDVIAA